MPTTRSKTASSQEIKKSAKAFAKAGEKLVKNVVTSKPVKQATAQMKKTGKKVIDDINNHPKVKKVSEDIKVKSQKIIDHVAPPKTQETFKIKGEELIKKVKELINEGNVRKIIIKGKDGRDIMVLPMTLVVVGALVAPVLAAVGAVAALVTECSITVERNK